MTEYTAQQLSLLDKRFKANLVNSVTGYKSANLIGTISENGISNLAVFNSIVHIGSNPALLGFILRPLTVERHTYDNIKATKFFTVNQIHTNIITQAHQTSAKYPKGISEFGKTGLHELFVNGIPAPFVKASAIQIACKYVNEYVIEENGCLLVIGSIELLRIHKSFVKTDGWVNHEKAQSAAIIGLDGYAQGQILNRFEYARPDQPPKKI